MGLLYSVRKLILSEESLTPSDRPRTLAERIAKKSGSRRAENKASPPWPGQAN